MTLANLLGYVVVPGADAEGLFIAFVGVKRERLVRGSSARREAELIVTGGNLWYWAPRIQRSVHCKGGERRLEGRVLGTQGWREIEEGGGGRRAGMSVGHEKLKGD